MLLPRMALMPRCLNRDCTATDIVAAAQPVTGAVATHTAAAPAPAAVPAAAIVAEAHVTAEGHGIKLLLYLLQY